jgi:hypothetical protein
MPPGFNNGKPIFYNGEPVQACEIVCVASFSFVQTSSTSCAFSFTNLSTGDTSYSWDFDDGGASSTLENPTHTFTTNGPHSVTLTLNGGECETTQVVQCLLDCTHCSLDVVDEATLVIGTVTGGSTSSNCGTVCSNVAGTKLLGPTLSRCRWLGSESLGTCDTCGTDYFGTGGAVTADYDVALSTGPVLTATITLSGGGGCSDENPKIAPGVYVYSGSIAATCSGTHVLSRTTNYPPLCTMPSTVSVTI